MRKLVIDRKKWLRGEGDSRSCLLRESDKKMCCLGFDMLSRGFKKKDILGIRTPGDPKFKENSNKLIGLAETTTSHLSKTYSLRPSQTCTELMEVNDIEDIDCKTREEELTKLFSKIDTEVTFIN